MSLKDWLILALIAAVAGGGIYLRHHWMAEGAAQQLAIDQKSAQKAVDAYDATQGRGEDAAAATVHVGAITIAKTTAATAATVRTITRIVHDSPAAPACVLPADSVRNLQSEVDAANAAAGGLR